MNWGQKLAVSLGIFIVFISTLGYFMIKASGEDSADKDYYEKGVNFDTEYKKRQKLIDDALTPSVNITNVAIEIQFKQAAKGEMIFYRPSNKTMDKRSTFVTDVQNKVIIPTTKLSNGAWDMELQWADYLYKQRISIP